MSGDGVVRRGNRGGPVTRREFVTLGIGAFTVLVAPGALRFGRRLHRRSIPIMGTVAEVAVVESDGERARRAIEAAFDALHRVEATMTRFDSRSDVGRANLEAGKRAVPVSRETAEVLRAALGWAEASGGVFDPCLGGAVELWDVEHRVRPPEREEVARFAGGGLYRLLDLGWREGTPVVRSGDPRVAIDLGGIAKGYGVDRAAEALRAHGVRDGMVNVGGDLVALGVSENGDAWRVGIRSPERPGEIGRVIRISDRAVATSGDYLRYFEHGGRRYHHLIDPATGSPSRSDGLRSVTVVAETCMTADAAATMAFCMPHRRSAAILSEHRPDARIVGAG